MRAVLALLTVATLAGCANPPLPAVDPGKAWIEMFTTTGRLVMAESLDGRKLNDGRYFQVDPGSHELEVRFDYEMYAGGGLVNDPFDRTCYLTVRYDGFKAGQRYRLEGRAIAMQASARLYDSNRQIVAEDRAIHCIP